MWRPHRAESGSCDQPAALEPERTRLRIRDAKGDPEPGSETSGHRNLLANGPLRVAGGASARRRRPLAGTCASEGSTQHALRRAGSLLTSRTACPLLCVSPRTQNSAQHVLVGMEGGS